MARVKTKVRAGVIAQLDSNAGLASLLTRYYAGYGDWRKLFTAIDDIAKVTAGDVQRVAGTYFVKKNRTVAYTTPAGAGGAAMNRLALLVLPRWRHWRKHRRRTKTGRSAPPLRPAPRRCRRSLV